MSDGDGLSLCARAAKSQVKLLAHRGDFINVIKEGDIPEGGADAQALCAIVGDRRGGGSAIHVEEIPSLKYRHQLFHESGIGGGLGALMVVDAGGIGNASHHPFEKQGNTVRGHSWMEFVRF